MTNKKIYYFTGTGNSLYIAKLLSKKIDAEFISIPKVMTSSDISADCIGIVFPVYMYNAPKIVYDFIKKIKSCNYLFIVMTMGGKSGKTADRIESILEQNNISLSAGFSILMPDNYIIWNEAAKQDKQEELFKTANSRMEHITSIINEKKSHFDDEKILNANVKDMLPFPFFLFPTGLFQFFCDLGFKEIPKMDKAFKTNEKCNGCETCRKVCPVNDIDIVDHKPVWKNHCEQCLACIQWCPQEAIEYAKSTIGKKRYHNPHVSISEMINE